MKHFKKQIVIVWSKGGDKSIGERRNESMEKIIEKKKKGAT